MTGNTITSASLWSLEGRPRVSCSWFQDLKISFKFSNWRCLSIIPNNDNNIVLNEFTLLSPAHAWKHEAEVIGKGACIHVCPQAQGLWCQTVPGMCTNLWVKMSHEIHVHVFYSHHNKNHSIVLVDFNEFSSVVWKVQHSHSRHQKTTSSLVKITLKGINDH